MLNHESVAELCENYPHATASSPFGPDTVVYKVGNKMFALLALEQERINVKCDPMLAIELREQFAAVEPGWHMSKKHWNSIYWTRDAISQQQLSDWITASYDLVVSSLTKNVRESLSA